MPTRSGAEFHIPTPMFTSQQSMSENCPILGTHAGPPGDPSLTELVHQLCGEIRRMDQHVGESLSSIEERVVESDRTVQGIMGRLEALEEAIREPRHRPVDECPQPQ